MKVLIVDDSKAMRMIVRKTMKDAGFDADFDEAEDGAIALDKIRSDMPGLVLSDWNMPNMNGIDLLKAMNEEGIKTRFGFVTTESTADMKKAANDAGAMFMISKPFTVESFKTALTRVIR